MVFYMLNKIADYELKVVMNLYIRPFSRGRCCASARTTGSYLCRHGKRSVTVGK